MPEILNGFQLMEEWKNRTGSLINIGMKDKCRYQMKLYKSVPYPDITMMTPAQYKTRVKACNELLQKRIKITEQLKKADAGDHLLAYAEEVFLNKELPINGVVEAVPFIEGAEAYGKHRGEALWIEQAFHQAAEALVRMHDNGLLHTDIKPENMVFTVDGANKVHCTLIDFDKSCFIGSVPEDVGGTQNYQAPELLEALLEEDEDKIPALVKKIGPYSDVFALGATFLVILTGKAPIVRKDKSMVWHVEWDRSTVTQPYLKDLLDAMMAPDPIRRPTAEAVAESIDKKTLISAVSKYTLWDEHDTAYSLNSKKQSMIRKITPEMYNGEKGYCVKYYDGNVRHYPLVNMLKVSILVPKNSPDAVIASRTPTGEKNTLLPKDAASYTINISRLNELNWTLCYDDDGYYFITKNGEQRRTNISAMLFHKVLKSRV